jgi:hypothetical protein
LQAVVFGKFSFMHGLTPDKALPNPGFVRYDMGLPVNRLFSDGRFADGRSDGSHRLGESATAYRQLSIRFAVWIVGDSYTTCFSCLKPFKMD